MASNGGPTPAFRELLERSVHHVNCLNARLAGLREEIEALRMVGRTAVEQLQLVHAYELVARDAETRLAAARALYDQLVSGEEARRA